MQSVHFSRLAASFHDQPYVATGQTTFADGLADDRLIEPAFSASKSCLDDVITVDEEQLRDALRQLWQGAGIKAESAGAAALAGLLAYPTDELTGRVAVIVSGRNLDPDISKELLGDSAPPVSQEAVER